MGPNGSGKSSLGLLAAGLIPEIIPAEVKGTHSFPKRAGLLLQNPSTQFFALSVKEELGTVPKGFGLESLRGKNVFELSEGEKQRVNLAANLCSGQQALFLDEPLELLDPKMAKSFLDAIRRFKGKRAMFWLDKDSAFVERERKIFLGRFRNPVFPKPKKRIFGKKILEADFSVARGSFAINDAQFSLREGEKIGIIGLNGSGKSSLLKAIAGILPFKGKVSAACPIGFSPQNPDHVFFEKTVEEEIANQRAAEFFGLGAFSKMFPEKLSKGQKKLLSIASLGRQKLVLLDEPTTWLDAENRARVCTWLNGSKSAFLVATHDKKLLEYCDRAMIVEGGGLKECSSTAAKQFFRAGR